MLIYNLVVSLYGFVIKAAAINKEKAKQWVDGRRDWRAKLSEQVAALDDRPRIWVHCASYGEFEQGRPLIEQIKRKYPRYQVILSFFSPSGFEAFKNYKEADVICYLPLDSKKNARDFLNIIRPDRCIFVKYEFWLHYLYELKTRRVQTYLVSATFKPHHPFFKWYGSIFRRSLLTFEKIFLQDQASVRLLESIGITNTIVTGDTRFDRVIDIKNNFKGFDELEAFKADHFLIVAGSTYSKDEDLLLSVFLKLQDREVKLIMAPHELSLMGINSLKSKLERYGLSFCLYSKGIKAETRVLIVDKMGLLSRLYYYGDCAYIGGGFGDGIHNTLEPAVYGQPVFIYGDNYHKFNEAVTMVKLGAVKSVLSVDVLFSEINELMRSPAKREQIRKILEKYFAENTDVSGRILKEVKLK